MALDHDFLLLDRERDGEWELVRFINDPRAIHLHDDFVRYIQDTLIWIPTFNPGRGESHWGLCMWGQALIETDGAAIAAQVFNAWAALLAIGPSRLALTGSFSWAASDRDPPSPTNDWVTQLEGGYDRLDFERDQVVDVLRQLGAWCEVVRSSAGRMVLYHEGV